MTNNKSGKLIADSGSTKTDWLLSDGGTATRRAATQGINPYMLTEEKIESILRDELLPQLGGQCPETVEFYGAGCRGEAAESVKRVLRKLFNTENITVESDLLGAARALCGESEGIACILGTGSNSCFYDGEKIAANVSCLGFILGDEGSGAVLGRRLVGDAVKGALPECVVAALWEACPGGVDEVLRRVYKETFPNRFLASLAPVLHRFRHEPAVHQLLVDEFKRFFLRNTAHYRRPDLPVNFVGSIAYYFQEELKEAALACGQTTGRILRSPMEAF